MNELKNKGLLNVDLGVREKLVGARVLCRLGFHKWLYRLPDWGGDGHTLREDTNLREQHCPTCKCTWLQDGVMRICRRGCGTHHTFWRHQEGWR